MPPVAIVQHEPSVPPGSVIEALEEARVDHVVVEAWRDRAWPRAGELAALVVMGGTMNVDQVESYPFLGHSRTLTAEALESGLPTVGICLGAQMMARVLGGEVFRAETRNALFSSLEVEASGDPVLEPFAAGTPVLQFHEDTFSIPPGAVPLARSAATGLHQAFRYGECAYAVQFHFEVDDAILKGWCAEIGDEAMRAEWGTSTDALMAEATRHMEAQHRAGKELLANFLEVAGIAPPA